MLELERRRCVSEHKLLEISKRRAERAAQAERWVTAGLIGIIIGFVVQVGVALVRLVM